jgi:hypothetical protein
MINIMNNNNKLQFTLPKMQKALKNDLISILSLQPKTVTELEQHKRIDFQMNTTNNNNDNSKSMSYSNETNSECSK